MFLSPRSSILLVIIKSPQNTLMLVVVTQLNVKMFKEFEYCYDFTSGKMSLEEVLCEGSRHLLNRVKKKHSRNQ